MIEYTDAELMQLFQEFESDTIERKRSWAGRVDIRKDVCAFANDLPGNQKPGVIFVGVEDDGSCAGIDVDDELLRNLADMKSDGAILPLPSINVQRMAIDGCEVAVVVVQPSPDAPLRFLGRVWVRVGPTVQQATPDEERRLSERHQESNQTVDLRPSDARVSDLDLEFIENTYIHQAVSSDVLEQNRCPLDIQLQTLRLTNRDRPTRGAMIAFGRIPQLWEPGALVQFLRFQGDTTRTPIISQKVIRGQLHQALWEVDRVLKINIGVSSDFTSGPEEVREPDYPGVAIEQVAHNAIMHRSYDWSNTPVRIHWFSDESSFRALEAFTEASPRENIDSGATSYRNPLIAEIMYHLGFAQRFGLGLQIAREAMQLNGNPPIEFGFASTHVTVTPRSAR